MKNPTNMGMNKTGIDISPNDSKALIEGAAHTIPSSAGGAGQLALERSVYIDDADTVGSVALPGTLRGVASSALQKLQGYKPGALIDKLGERLAFERTGVRLYDALITKCERNVYRELPAEMDAIVLKLKAFREEEASHFKMVRDVMISLGADPTAQTPCADSNAVASMGLIQVLADPRMSVSQSLNAILVVELADNDGWQLLIELTEEMGFEDISNQFRGALTSEAKHLMQVRHWLQQIVFENATAAQTKAA